MPKQDHLQLLWERLLAEPRELVASYLQAVGSGCDPTVLHRDRQMLADVAHGVESVRRVLFPGADL